MPLQDAHHSRLQDLKRRVQEADLDIFLVTSRDSIYYLTGLTYEPLERPFFILVPPAGEIRYLTPHMEHVHVRSALGVDEVHTYWEYPAPSGQGWAEVLTEMLGDAQKVGVEPSLPHGMAIQLAQVDVVLAPFVDQMRLVKSPDEIAKLRVASRFATQGMEAILRASYRGVSEIELFSQARPLQLDAIRTTDYDALNSSFLTVTWPSRLAEQPHGIPEIDDRLTHGPHIALSFMRVNGYSAESERTYFVEPPTQDMRNLFATMIEARRRALAEVRPGAPCADIDRTANGFLRDEGLGDYLMHRTGHGIGLGNHEAPFVADGSNEVLEENMVISIEPGLYMPNFGAFRHSDTYLVTKDGFENLTPFADDIDSLTILQKKPLTRLRGAITRRIAGLR